MNKPSVVGLAPLITLVKTNNGENPQHVTQ